MCGKLRDERSQPQGAPDDAPASPGRWDVGHCRWIGEDELAGGGKCKGAAKHRQSQRKTLRAAKLKPWSRMNQHLKRRLGLLGCFSP